MTSSSIAYISNDVLLAVADIAKDRFMCTLDDIGLIYPEVERKPYQKLGQKLVSHQIDFIVFDKHLNKIGVVKRKDIQKLDPAGQEGARATTT